MMKQFKWRYLFCSLGILGMMTGCGNEGAVGEQGSDTNQFKITTVRWSDWGDDFTKGFLEDAEEKAGIQIEWDIHLSADWGERSLY